MANLLLGTLTFTPSVEATAPEIVLTPDWGYYDTVISVSGTGFAPSSDLIFTWEGLDHWQRITSTNLFGNFIFSFHVPDGSTCGDHVIIATDELNNTASDIFTLYNVYANGGSVGIDTPKLNIRWHYDSNEFYCDFWEFFHDSQRSWYTAMYYDYGIYVLRLTYGGVTYLFDLANGMHNAWPQPLVEEVVAFGLIDVNHVQGTIHIYDPTGTTLLVTVVVDIIATPTPSDYYAMSFTIIAEEELADISFYVAYNLDVYTSNPNWAYYDSNLDAVYQYYGPSYYWDNIPDMRKGYAGFASIVPHSTYHDAVAYYHQVQYVVNLLDYDYDYNNNDFAYGDNPGDCGVGLQWEHDLMTIGDEITIPLAFAVSDTTFDVFEEAMTNAKLFAYELLGETPSISLSPTEDVGLSIVTVTGQGFMPYSQVTIHFADVFMTSTNADPEGNIEVNFVVPVLKAGEYNVTAKDEYGTEAETSFTTITQLEDLAAAISSLNLKLTEISNLIVNIHNDLELKIDDLAVLINALTSDGTYSLSDIILLISNLELKLDLTMEDIADLVETVADNHEELVAMIEALASGFSLSDLADLIDNLADDHSELIDLIHDLEDKLDLSMEDQLDLIEAVADNHEELVGLIETLASDMSLSDLANLINTLASKTDDVVIPLLEEINATVVSVEEKIDGHYLSLNATIGEIEVKLDETAIPFLQTINTTLLGIQDDLIILNSSIGEIDMKVDETVIPILGWINATIIDVKDNLVTVNSTIGRIELDIDDVDIQLESVQGDIATGVTTITAAITNAEGEIIAQLGNVTVGLSNLNTEIGAVHNNLVNLETDLGTIQGNITAIHGDIVTIQTSIGTVTATVDSIVDHLNVQPVTIALSSIATISAIIVAVVVLRKIFA